MLKDIESGHRGSQFRRKLLHWYRKNKRDLPWRRTRNPYAIWISEIMLQQTQVATVIPYYERFLKKFPAVRHLARAEEEEVLALWSGLGYYRRAKLLHAGAKKIQEEFGGRLPERHEELLQIPGIGRYTAGAIASIAFTQPYPVADGNVVRVLSRIFCLKGHAKDGRLQKKVWRLAQAILDPKHPGDFNQALMELGATVCRSELPGCERCPVLSHCGAAQQGNPENFPETSPSPKTVELHRLVALCERAGKILLVKRKNNRWFQGMWELPHQYAGKEDGVTELGDFLRRELQLNFRAAKEIPQTIQGITHHRITSSAWQGSVEGPIKLGPAYQAAKFFTFKDILLSALPSLDRKILQAAKKPS